MTTPGWEQIRDDARRQRALEYAARRAAGETLQRIADDEGCTRERVRQVLAEFPDTKASKAESRLKRHGRSLTNDRERAEKILRLTQTGQTFQEIGETFGLTGSSIARIIGQFPDLNRRALAQQRLQVQHGAARRYSDEALTNWITWFLAEHEPPYSSLAWKRFLEENDGPNARTFTMRYGLWREMAARFGFEPVGRDSGAPRSRRDCSQAVLRVAVEQGREPSANGYTKAKRKDEPAEGTVRGTIGAGSWKNVLHWLRPRTDAPPEVPINSYSTERNPD